MDVTKYWGMMADTIANYGPKIIAALAILIVAWIIAKLVQFAISFAVQRLPIAGTDASVGQSLGKAAFWIVILIALPGVLGALNMQSLVQPLQQMADKFLAFLPNLIGAGLIFFIGSIVAKVVRQALTAILDAAQADKLAATAGVDEVTGSSKITNAVGLLAYTLIIIPVAIAALDALAIESISGPAKQMLNGVLDAIPNIFGAAMILGITYLIAKFVRDTAQELLPSFGVDNFAENVGLNLPESTTPSKLVAMVAYVIILLFGSIEAAKLLDFAFLSNILSHILELGGNIMLGAAIIGVGMYAANLVSGIIGKTSGSPAGAALVKGGIIFLSVAMGLEQMGLAEEIISTGFTLLIAALAIGVALAFGLGGKDAAGKLLAKWSKNL